MSETQGIGGREGESGRGETYRREWERGRERGGMKRWREKGRRTEDRGREGGKGRHDLTAYQYQYSSSFMSQIFHTLQAFTIYKCIIYTMPPEIKKT